MASLPRLSAPLMVLVMLLVVLQTTHADDSHIRTWNFYDNLDETTCAGQGGVSLQSELAGEQTEVQNNLHYRQSVKACTNIIKHNAHAFGKLFQST